MTTAYDEINSLEEIDMIGGDSLLITIVVTDSDGAPVNITAGTTKWILSPYGRPDVVSLEKTADIIDTDTCEVQLVLADTKDLYGKYIQQLSHVDFAGKEFRKQGLVTISPRIATS